MSRVVEEFPSRFAVGNGSQTRFSVARPGDIIENALVTAVRRKDWQGDQLLYPTPRTNLALDSNNFLSPQWSGNPSLALDFVNGSYYAQR